jgi:pyruvate ferredoxin oxidoreductase gamma subunit
MPALGGQGAVTAAHIIATAADYEGYYAVSNPFFGAEKRMAPAESYARIAVEPIFDRGEVVYPDVIMVFHPQVITMGKSYTMPFYSGIKRNGLIIINSEEDLLTEEDKEYLESLEVKVLNFNATKFAIDIAGTELATNMAMLGALFGAIGVSGCGSHRGRYKIPVPQEVCGIGWNCVLGLCLGKEVQKEIRAHTKEFGHRKGSI